MPPKRQPFDSRRITARADPFPGIYPVPDPVTESESDDTDEDTPPPTTTTRATTQSNPISDRVLKDADEDDDLIILPGNPNPPPKIDVINISSDEEEDVETDVKPKLKTPKFEPQPELHPMLRPINCPMCMTQKPTYKSFKAKGCMHVYCCDCIQIYVAAKLDAGVATIGCPEAGCNGTLDPEFCKEVVERGTYVKWGEKLCEAAFDLSVRVYCPFEGCGAMMVVDDVGFGGVANMTMAECLVCHRLFCAKCRTGWHEGVGCRAPGDV